MASPLDDLVTLLDLEVIEVNIFRGFSPEENRVRVFGGQVAGQSLVAAARTVDEASRQVHSLHAYFLRPATRLHPSCTRLIACAMAVVSPLAAS